ncbi:hypothetical protein WN943_003994 [Citrus x changshan-huyou]
MVASSWARRCLNRHLKEIVNPLLPALDLISLLFVDAGSQTLLAVLMAWTRRCLNRHLKETANPLLSALRELKWACTEASLFQPPFNFLGLKPAIRKPEFFLVEPVSDPQKEIVGIYPDLGRRIVIWVQNQKGQTRTRTRFLPSLVLELIYTDICEPFSAVA